VDGGDLQSARQRHARDHRLEAQRDQQRDKQEQAAKLGPKVPGLETKSTRIRHGRRLHARIHGPFLIRTARQFGKALGGEDFPNRRRA